MDKKRKEFSRTVIILTFFTLVFLLVIGTHDAGTARANGFSPQEERVQPFLQPTGVPEEYIYFLPVIHKAYPFDNLNVFGVHMTITEGGGLNQIADTETRWVRGGGVPWSWVEPNEGDRDWGALASQEAQYINAANNGLSTIVIVGNTPGWAQKVSGYSCGPILEGKLDAFADFMYDLVSRYSQPPYSIKVWEIWNEPDIDPALVPSPDSPFGCWGDDSDDYYGGGYYAEMLKRIYPRIKQADHQAQVVVGGLLLDCDLYNPPPGKLCKPSKFLEGILINGGGPFFDGVSFHAYDYYGGSLATYSNHEWDSYWNTSGPVAIKKSNFLMGVLNGYATPNKFLMNTESAVLCDACDEDADFETTKAYFVAYAYAAAIAQGFEGNIWYSVQGWRNSELLDGDLNPLPAYNTYKFAAGRLYDAKFTRALDEYANVFGYVFERGDQSEWVLWSKDGASHVITLPGVPTAASQIGTDGTAVALPLSTSLTVTSAPIFLEW